MDMNRAAPRIDTSRFAMVPRQDVPRATFIVQHTHKTTFDAGYLIPIYLDEVLPADVHRGEVQVFTRMMTPTFPFMDVLECETFFFFVPNRLVWTNWPKFMGERASPGDSISYLVPTIVSKVSGYDARSLYDYFGLPTAGQVGVGNTFTHSALPARAYALIYDAWFRDENLQNGTIPALGDGPDGYANYALYKRNKKHDYFTSCLPWPLKGGVDVTLPMAGNAPVRGIAVSTGLAATAGTPASSLQTYGGAASGWSGYWQTTSAGIYFQAGAAGAGATPQIYADMSQVTGATINALRLAFMTQRLLEKDARGGTRYTEILKEHFGVSPEDMRLQRPEYIGGGKTRVETQAIPQTSATGLTGGNTPIGSLGAAATATDRHTFTYHATEHGMIIGLVNVRAQLTYQQGLRKLWSRSTRYDFYWPTFAHLGEQAVLNKEIYCRGDANDDLVFGYQERWAELRYHPSMITGYFRSTDPNDIDEWHAAEEFGSLPALNSAFIQDKTNTVLTRVINAGASADGMQFLFDSFFSVAKTRALPMYSIPGAESRF